MGRALGIKPDTSVKTEIIAGVTTFFAMCYIILVNPNQITGFYNIIPSVATAPALIYVGVLMIKNIKDVDMDDLASAAPAFLTFVLMPLTYSISNGIAMGAISYVLIKLFTGKYSKKDIVVTIIAILFALRFAFINTL